MIIITRTLCRQWIPNCGPCQLLAGHRGVCLCSHYAAGGVEVPGRACGT